MIRSIISDRSSGRSPLSRESATMCSRSRSEAACSTSWTGSILTNRNNRLEA